MMLPGLTSIALKFVTVLIATGLQNFVVTTGDGSDELNFGISNPSLPVPGGQIVFNGGGGTETFVLVVRIVLTGLP